MSLAYFYYNHVGRSGTATVWCSVRGIETGDLVGTLTRQHKKKLFNVWDVEMQSCHSRLGTRLIGIWEGGHHLSETHTNRFTTACASSSPSSSFLPTVSLSLSPGRKLPPENMTHFTGGQSLLKQNTRREEEMLCMWEQVTLFHLAKPHLKGREVII